VASWVGLHLPVGAEWLIAISSLSLPYLLVFLVNILTDYFLLKIASALEHQVIHKCYGVSGSSKSSGATFIKGRELIMDSFSQQQ